MFLFQRRILAVYLHHDASVLTNVFCTQLLGFESIMHMLENNFILWGWDITFESNRTKLQHSVNNCLGSTAAMSLRNIPVDRLPAIILIMKIRSTTEIFSVVYGKSFDIVIFVSSSTWFCVSNNYIQGDSSNSRQDHNEKKKVKKKICTIFFSVV